MHKRQATLEFDEKCKAAADVEEIERLFFAAMADCGIRYAALASHTDPLRPVRGAVMMCNYPADYQQWFSANDCAKYDPAFWLARRGQRPFHWSDLPRLLVLTRKQMRVLDEARDFGIADGMTIPLSLPGAMPASCSLVPGPDGLEPMLTPDLAWMAACAHFEARRRLPDWKANVRLSPAQREVLYWVAQGKSDRDIGTILGLSPRTVGKRVDAVRALFDVSERGQAVLLAVTYGELQPDILFYPDERPTWKKGDSH